MDSVALRKKILVLMFRQHVTEDMVEHVALEMEKIECYEQLEEMLCIPREQLESTIEKQYAGWLRSQFPTQNPESGPSI
jgi:hypothetical protein